MNVKYLASAAGVALSLLLPLGSVQAADNLFGSKSIAGVCMVSRDAIITNSKVGEAANKRLNQLAQQADNNLQKKHTPLERDVQAFQQKAASLSDAEREKQGEALQKRMAAFDREARSMDIRIQITRDKVTQQIVEKLEPLIIDTYKKHQCGILLDRDAVIGGNNSNDLTGPALKALDANMKTINFNLEPLPKELQQQQQSYQ